MVVVEGMWCFVDGRKKRVNGKIKIWIFEKEVGRRRWNEEKL